MNSLEKIIGYNEKFVENGEYRTLQTATKFPMKDMVIVSCMDTRLTELLPKAMNIANGDAKIIKVAGAVINHPFGSVMRSIIVAVHILGAEEVYVVGHDDCGMASITPEKMIDEMLAGGIAPGTIELLEHSGVHFKKWFRGFENVEDSVKNSVSVIRNHPLIPDRVVVTGMVIDPNTGGLRIIVDGFPKKRESI